MKDDLYPRESRRMVIHTGIDDHKMAFDTLAVDSVCVSHKHKMVSIIFSDGGITKHPIDPMRLRVEREERRRRLSEK